MNTPIKRLHYFDQQFLRATDFTAEQDYHRDMRRGLNRVLHRWGVAEGLSVVPSGGAVVVNAGFAVDAQGREIVLGAATTVELSDQPANQPVYITIRYADRTTDPTDETGVRDDTRWVEEPELKVDTVPPADPTTDLILAVVNRAGTLVSEVTGGGRRQTGGAWLDDELDNRVPWSGGTITGGLAVRSGLDVGAADAPSRLRVTRNDAFPLPTLGRSAHGGLHLVHATDAADSLTGISFSGQGSYSRDDSQAGIYVQSSGGYGTKMHFATTDSYWEGPKVRMSINQHGWVGIGIGTTSPNRPLHVEGHEIHSGGSVAGYSFSNRESPYVESGDNGQRWVWYSAANVARLWAGGDKLMIWPSGDMQVPGNLGTHGLHPNDGLPAGWGGGVHTWDVVARGALATTRFENGTATVTGYLNRDGNLWVGNDATVGNQLVVAGGLSVGHAASVGHGLTIGHAASVGHGLTVGHGLSVGHDATIHNHLIVHGARAYLLGNDGWGFWFMAGGTEEGVHNAFGFNIPNREVGGGWTKTFVIDHPLAPEDRLLVHSTLEGPEVGVYYRGEAELIDGAAEVELPHYFEALTHDDGRTVQLTPVAGDGAVAVAATEVRDGRFGVRALGPAAPGQRVYWEVKAIRSDVEVLEVERDKPYIQTTER